MEEFVVEGPITPSALMEQVILVDDELFGPEGACPVMFEDSDLPRVLVVSGENAGGKSLLCKALDQFGREEAKRRNMTLEMMLVGMARRTTAGIERAFIFGDENRHSTGNISVRSTLTGMRTSESRGHAHWLLFDEPDIGLAEGYATALGERLADYAINGMTKHALGLVVVSHCRGLVRPLIEAGAMSARVGGDLRPVREWLEHGDLPRTLEDLEALSGKAHRRSLAIEKIVQERREAQKTETTPGMR